jgi:peroxiredoxin
LAAFQRDLARFEAANAQVLGVSVDHVYSHNAFGEQLGGLSYPLLADFNPHGAITRRYGLWRDEKGYGRRACFLIDLDGTLTWARVYESGPPDNQELLRVLGQDSEP